MEVIKALSAVMAELPAIGKADKSPEGYSYRGIEAITKHLQPLLAKHGVVIVPSATVTEVRQSPAMKDGWQDVYITVDWAIYGPDGSSIPARTAGIGRDRADKGSNKAQTQAFKYLLLHLLSIADKADDADGLTYEEERADPGLAEAQQVFHRLKDIAGTEVAERLKVLAAESHRKLNIPDLIDLRWREQVVAVLDGPAVPALPLDGAA